MSNQKITFEELRKHNTEQDCWIAIRGKVYNATEWLPKHPGGIDTIALNAGRDATTLFEAYHPLKTTEMLPKFYVGELEPCATHPTFPPMSDFYKTLKVKIENYFIDNKIDPRAPSEMLIRSAGLIFSAFYFHYLSVSSEWTLLSLLYAMLSGVVYALICFMPVHEGSHASTGDSPLQWRLLGAVHDFVNGASFYSWCHQHFLGHHPFTNVVDKDSVSHDPDTLTANPDIRRIKPNQSWFDHYRYQKYYVPVLYGLLGIKFRINDFLIMFVTRKNGMIEVNPPSQWHLYTFLGGKAFWFTYRILIPAFLIGWYWTLVLFLVSDFITSYTLAFVFQVNHVVPQAEWITVDKETGKVSMDWAEVQLRTTLDYAHDSYLTTFFTGALNYQVTHHLFPYISQIHYPKIAPIIKEHAKKHNLPYHHLNSFQEALNAHLSHLDNLGHEKV